MKKIVAVLLVLMMAFGLCACNGSDSSAAYEKKIKQLEDRIAELEGMLAGRIPVGDSTNQEQTPGVKTIELGQKVVIDDVLEFTIHSCAWEDKILPSNISGTYSYKADQEDETYLVLRGTLTNLNGNSFDVRYIQESEIRINDKYSFTVEMDTEDTDGKGFGDAIKPLQTMNLVIYTSVSDGVKNIFEDATLTLNMLNDPERTKYFFDKEDECKNTYTIQLVKGTFAG